MASVTFKGNPLTLLGKELKVGEAAPEFKVQKAADLSDFTLESTAGRTRIILTVPSLDTPVCDAETRHFNEAAANLPGVEVICVSMDLPFAQRRWCGAAGVERVTTASDHRLASFGNNYGVLIQGGALDRLLARAVFVVDSDNRIRHVEYVREMTETPNYEAALAAAR